MIADSPRLAHHHLPVAERDQVLDLFRRWGYRQARLDPLGFRSREVVPELQIEGDIAEIGRRFYCGTIGVEFMHIPDAGRRRWIQERMESDAPVPPREEILDRLVKAEVFEQVLQRHYPGTKRFSLEGIAAMIPLLGEILNEAGDHGVVEAVIGMSHRGRLNVFVQILGKSPVDVIAGFEDVDPRSVLGGGDVKYHLGATGEYVTRSGNRIQARVVSGPSHLEAVDPVTLGRVRAKQVRSGDDGQSKVLPVLIHGDAGFAGQGIAAETLNLAHLDGYTVGGTLHVIVNNLIGFTANPGELYSAEFSSDVAKRLPIPILHVNAEDPEAVVRAGVIASAYRRQFASGVVVDLIGFRRHGHSEIDDPTMTQPLLYQKIGIHPPLWKTYSEDIGVDPATNVEEARKKYERAKEEAESLTKAPRLSVLPAYWSGYSGGRYDPACEVDTGVPAEILKKTAALVTSYPAQFRIHPKVKRMLEKRREMGEGNAPVDFGMGEALAFATLLQQGIPIRLSGQDSRRGTFGQRQAVLFDTETGKEYIPLLHLHPEQARFEAFNSMLSEAAVMGFEYGYSRESPEALVMWEAQFGDFANGAQVTIDQFIAAGEDKWGLLAGLVLLLPHGYEGQGPEHSSARLERFLQLAAEDNFQICQPSTAAQYFHLLRRQAMRRWRKPLVVMTPKSMLRHPAASSPLDEFSHPRYQMVIPEEEIESAERVIVCSGKIGTELRIERKRLGNTSTAIILLEQFYPFPESELGTELARHDRAREVVWVQEEPANMGALNYMLPRLERIAGGRPVRSVRRSESASPATGSAKAHQMEQKTLLNLAFRT